MKPGPFDCLCGCETVGVVVVLDVDTGRTELAPMCARCHANAVDLNGKDSR